MSKGSLCIFAKPSFIPRALVIFPTHKMPDLQQIMEW